MKGMTSGLSGCHVSFKEQWFIKGLSSQYVFVEVYHGTNKKDFWEPQKKKLCYSSGCWAQTDGVIWRNYPPQEWLSRIILVNSKGMSENLSVNWPLIENGPCSKGSTEVILLKTGWRGTKSILEWQSKSPDFNPQKCFGRTWSKQFNLGLSSSSRDTPATVPLWAGTG